QTTGVIASTAESAATSCCGGGTKSSRSRRITVKARWQYQTDHERVRRHRVGLQDGRRTRQRDGKNRTNEFFCGRRQGPNLGERGLAGGHHRRRRQILRTRGIRSAAGGLSGRKA